MESKLPGRNRTIELIQSALPAVVGLAAALAFRWAPRPELLVLGPALALVILRPSLPAWPTATFLALATLAAPFLGGTPEAWVDAVVASALGVAAVSALSTRDSVRQQTEVMHTTTAVMARDSRVRRRQEEQREKREAEYRSLVETSNDLIFSIDATGRWTFVNHKATGRIYGRDSRELIGAAFIDFVHPDYRDIELDKFAALMGGENSAQFETVHVRVDGEPIHLVVNATRLIDKKGNSIGISGTATDVTERVKVEERRRAFEERANQAKRLESLGVMAGGIAHDFNNLLLGVMGHAQLAKATLGDQSATEGHLDAIKTASDEAAELVLQLLAYAGKGRRRIERLDLTELVRGLLPVFEDRIQERAGLSLELESGLPMIRGDSGQLGRVVVNLALNASEAISDPSGTVSVTTRFDPTNQDVVLEVADDGVGMDEELRSRIFEPFFSTKFTGRGLGLAAVHGIIQAHEGTIDVESTLGEGSRFTIRLPAVMDSDHDSTGSSRLEAEATN